MAEGAGGNWAQGLKAQLATETLPNPSNPVA